MQLTDAEYGTGHSGTRFGKTTVQVHIELWIPLFTSN